MERLLRYLTPGKRVYIPGGPAEIMPLAGALRARPECLAGVELLAYLLPGINLVNYAGLNPTCRFTTFMMSPTLQSAIGSERLRILPLCYSATARYLTEDYLPDCAIAHVAAPVNGLCSLGISADFTAQVWPRADVRVLVVNRQMPAIRRAPHLAIADAHLLVEIDSPLVVSGDGPADPLVDAIADSVAQLIEDGATIECGIGGVPGAVWRHLQDHRDLTIATGMANGGIRALAEAGALRRDGQHQATIAIGDADFYAWLARSELLEMVPVSRSHDRAALAHRARFTAINSAVEVDLFGQINLEWRGGRQISGVGGAPDFIQAALQSPGGRSITALAATAAGGKISRIVPKLEGPSVSIPRCDIDTVVTEHGTADLRHCSVDERALALIEVAAPAHRAWLNERWRATNQS